MPQITFAIPFHRNRDYLERAIRSVLAQTRPDWNLVISDDAGPEGDLGAWLRTLTQDDRILYVRQPTNLGLAGNWNACMRLAEGEFVTLLHADDELEPRYAEIMLAAFDRHATASVLFCQAVIIDGAGRPVFSFADWYKRWLLPVRGREFSIRGEAGLRSVHRGNFIMCPTMCYRRRDLPEPLFDPRWRQVLDLDLITRLLFADKELVGLPAVAFRYRRHDANQTKLLSDSLTRFEEERDLYLRTAGQAEERGWSKAAVVCRRMAIVKLNLVFCVVQDAARLRFRSAMTKAKFLFRLCFPVGESV